MSVVIAFYLSEDKFISTAVQCTVLHVTISVEISKSGHYKTLIRRLGYIKVNEFTVNVYSRCLLQ